MTDILLEGHFEKAFLYSLANEGGYVNDPKDPGGATKYGVANFREKKSAYEEYIGRQVSDQEIHDLTLESAKEFYFHCYFEKINLHKIAQPGIAIAIFDCAILYGVNTAAMMAQRACNSAGAPLMVDGVIGPGSIKTFNMVDQLDFIDALFEQIEMKINRIIKADTSKRKFEKGWRNRANRLFSIAKLEPCVKKSFNN